jgi:hypothetical protein
MTLNSFLATHQIDKRIAQAMLRHADSRLIDRAYLDRSMLPMSEVISALPAFGQQTGKTTQEPEAGANAQRPAQRGTVSNGPALSQPVSGYLIEGPEDELAQLQELVDMTLLGYEMKNPASIDVGFLEKRAKGVEPSTFTLATLSTLTAKALLDAEVTSDTPSLRTISAQNPRPSTLSADPLLDELVRIWPTLSEALKLAVMGVVRASSL